METKRQAPVSDKNIKLTPQENKCLKNSCNKFCFATAEIAFLTASDVLPRSKLLPVHSINSQSASSKLIIVNTGRAQDPENTETRHHRRPRQGHSIETLSTIVV